MKRWEMTLAFFLACLTAFLVARVLDAGLISYPKTWATNEVLTSSDLNGNFTAVTGQVNGNLSDVNVSSTAAIKGSKLADAPNGVPTAKLNDNSVTSVKIANGEITTTDISGTANITGAQLSATAGIVSGQILDGTLVNADVATAAGIYGTKLSGPTIAVVGAGWTTTVGPVAPLTGLLAGDVLRFIEASSGQIASGTILSIASPNITLTAALPFTPDTGDIATRDDGVGGAKLNIGAATNAAAQAFGGFAGFVTSEVTLMSLPSITTRGGAVMVDVAAAFVWGPVSAAAFTELTVRVKMDGTTVATWVTTLDAPAGALDAAAALPVLVAFPFRHIPPANAHVYSVTAQRTSGPDTLTSQSASLRAWEAS